jgi:putative MFS transporter
MFLIDVIFLIVFAILQAFAVNYIQLSIIRFLLGVGIGGDYALASPIIAEAVPAKRRGRALTINWGLAWLSGEIISFAVGLLCLQFAGPNAWRWMLASGAIPAIAVLLGRRSMPESARWLYSEGRDDEARAAIDRLAGDLPAAGGGTGGATPHVPVRAVAGQDRSLGMAATISGEGSSTVPKAAPRSRGLSLRGLSAEKEVWGTFKRNTWFGLLNYVFEGAPFYALSVFLPTILKAAGFSKTDTGIAVGNVLLQLTGLVGILLIYLMIDRQGRKICNYWGFGGVTLALIVYDIVFPPHIWFLLLLFAVIEAAVWLGPASTDNLYLGELWPTRIRTTGAGYCAGAGRLSAIAGTLLLPIMLTHLGIVTALVPFILLSALGVLNTKLLGVETKGKTLEELWGR